MPKSHRKIIVCAHKLNHVMNSNVHYFLTQREVRSNAAQNSRLTLWPLNSKWELIFRFSHFLSHHHRKWDSDTTRAKLKPQATGRFSLQCDMLEGLACVLYILPALYDTEWTPPSSNNSKYYFTNFKTRFLEEQRTCIPLKWEHTVWINIL